MIPALLRGLLKEATKENGFIRSNLVEIVTIFTVAFIFSSPPKKKEDPMALRTEAVELKDGTKGRGVKVSVRNATAVANWVKGNLHIKVAPGTGVESDHKVKVHAKAGIRVARVGDLVVKDENGDVYVIKVKDFADLVKL